MVFLSEELLMVVGSSVEWRFGPVFGGRAVLLIEGCGYGRCRPLLRVTL